MSLSASRRTWSLVLILVLALILTAVLVTAASASISSSSHSKTPDRVLVGFRTGTPTQAMTAAHVKAGTKAHSKLDSINVSVMEVPSGVSVDDVIRSYRGNPNVAFVEPDYSAKIMTTPDDTLYWRQWAPAYVNAPTAWDTSTGSPAVTIAILDTGIELSHPDIAGRLIAGYDFVNSDADPSDDNGHGTGVAGIAAATGNNGLGVAGMDWNARVLPVKVMDATGSGSWSVIAQGIIWAADQGADVINMSLGGPASSTLQSAIQYAYSKGCVLVAASGNESSGVAIYPAGYPEVIAVGSVYRDTLSTFSNYGAHLDVVAPGETIDTIARGGTYGRIAGTSAAAPFVAGLAALVRGAVPDLSPAQVMNAITSSARDLGASGWDAYYGWGHIDAQAALAAVGAAAPIPPTPEPPTPPEEPVAPEEPVPAEPATPEQPAPDTTAPVVTITSPAQGAVMSSTLYLTANASDDSGVIRVEFWVGTKLIGTDKSAPYSIKWNPKKGTYTIIAKAYDAAGNVGTSSPVTFTKK